MSHRRLNAGARTSLRIFRIVRNAFAPAVILYTIAVWFFGAPRPGVAMLCAIVGWFVVLTLLAKRIQCPYCEKAAVASFTPSWVQVPPFGQVAEIQCVRCRETIDVSGGPSPPSNISLERR